MYLLLVQQASRYQQLTRIRLMPYPIPSARAAKATFLAFDNKARQPCHLTKCKVFALLPSHYHNSVCANVAVVYAFKNAASVRCLCLLHINKLHALQLRKTQYAIYYSPHSSTSPPLKISPPVLYRPLCCVSSNF